MPDQIEKLNKELPKHYEQFFKMSLDLCCIAGFDGYFKVVNPAWANLLGYTLEELTAKPFIDFVHPDDKAKTAAEAEKLANGTDTISFENRYLSKDGTYKWLSWRSTIHAADEIFYAVASDITKWKEYEFELIAKEKELQETNQKHLNLLETITDGFFNLDSEWRFTYVNNQAQEIWKVRNIVGKSIYEVFPGFKNSKFEIHYQNAFKSNSKIHFEDYFEPLNVWRSVTIYPSNTGLSVFFHDITSAKLAAARIEEQEQMLIHSSKLASLGEMAGGIAHEINTPLAIISMHSENALEQLNETVVDQAAVSKALSVIQDTTSRIANIIRGLKTFAKDGAGDPFENCSIVNIVESTMSLCLQKFSFNGVQVKWQKPKIDCVVQCREVQISQVLLNLLNNSYEAISEFTEKWIEIEIVETNAYSEIIVTDSGNGIKPEVQNKIMEPFFTTKPVGSGTGLGLSISTGIIRAHHGSLKLDPTSNHTKFVITLPKQQPAELGSKTA